MASLSYLTHLFPAIDDHVLKTFTELKAKFNKIINTSSTTCHDASFLHYAGMIAFRVLVSAHASC